MKSPRNNCPENISCPRPRILNIISIFTKFIRQNAVVDTIVYILRTFGNRIMLHRALNITYLLSIQTWRKFDILPNWRVPWCLTFPWLVRRNKRQSAWQTAVLPNRITCEVTMPTVHGILDWYYKQLGIGSSPVIRHCCRIIEPMLITVGVDLRPPRAWIIVFAPRASRCLLGVGVHQSAGNGRIEFRIEIHAN